MPINTGDDIIASVKQGVTLVKTATATSVAAQWHTLWDRAGGPGAGTLTIGNTANGLVPNDATTGAPTINNFAGGAVGYLLGVEFGSTVASRIELYDRLFHAGSYALTPTGTTNLATQPSYSARVPSGTDFKGLEIWLEVNVAIAASAVTVAVGYTNQDGTAGRVTPASASLSSFIAGRIIKMPLQAGDTGVQKIESIVIGGTAAATGSINVIVARSLWTGRVRLANDGSVHGPDRTLMPVVYDSSCLALICSADSTSTGVPELLATIGSK